MPGDVGEVYTRSFEKFLRHTNEKQVFIGKISQYIEQYAAHSLLDIGAGNGSLAVPLSQQVEQYAAIEPNVKYAERLRKAGLHVIVQTFPTLIEDKYDLVLMSHVISYTLGNHATLIPAAWNLVQPNGHLLVVTHRGSEQDDWGSLLETVGLGETEKFSTRFGDIVGLVQERGQADIQRVVTTLETENISDMIQAMAFVASNGNLDRYKRFIDKWPQVEQVLNKKYRKGSGFSFPYLHLFVSAQKTESSST